jgi:hypothetical protein
LARAVAQQLVENRYCGPSTSIAAAVVNNLRLEAGIKRVRVVLIEVLPLRASRTISETVAPFKAGSASRRSRVAGVDVDETLAQPPSKSPGRAAVCRCVTIFKVHRHWGPQTINGGNATIVGASLLAKPSTVALVQEVRVNIEVFREQARTYRRGLLRLKAETHAWEMHMHGAGTFVGAAQDQLFAPDKQQFTSHGVGA